MCWCSSCRRRDDAVEGPPSAVAPQGPVRSTSQTGLRTVHGAQIVRPAEGRTNGWIGVVQPDLSFQGRLPVIATYTGFDRTTSHTRLLVAVTCLPVIVSQRCRKAARPVQTTPNPFTPSPSCTTPQRGHVEGSVRRAGAAAPAVGGRGLHPAQLRAAKVRASSAGCCWRAYYHAVPNMQAGIHCWAMGRQR